MGTRPRVAPHGDLPKLDAVVDQVVAVALGAPRVLGCPHLGTATGAGMVCACHPAAGVSCVRCATEHARRHPVDLEHTCSVCRTVVLDFAQVGLGVRNVTTFLVRPAGATALYVGELHVFALGVCEACA